MAHRLKLALIGDPHLAVARSDPDPYLDLDLGRKRHSDSAMLLEATIAAVNAEPDIDAAVLIGDMTRDGELFNHEAAAALLGQLKPPLYVVTGNHDYLRNRAEGVSYPGETRLDKDEFIEFYHGRGLPEPSAYYSAALPGGVELIVLDSNRTLAEIETDNAPIALQDHGWVGPAQLRWLEEKLEAAYRRKRLPLVVVHHTIMDQSPVEQPGHVLYETFRFWQMPQAPVLRELLARYEVPLVLSGHLHAESANMHQGIVNLVSSATVSYPHNWRVVTVSDNAIEAQSRSLEGQLSEDFLRRSWEDTGRGWGEELERYAAGHPLLKGYATEIRAMTELSGWWQRFSDGTMAAFKLQPEHIPQTSALGRAVLAKVAAIMDSYGPWKSARPDPKSLAIPLPERYR